MGEDDDQGCHDTDVRILVPTSHHAQRKPFLVAKRQVVVTPKNHRDSGEKNISVDPREGSSTILSDTLSIFIINYP